MRRDMMFDQERVHFTVAKFEKYGNTVELVIDPDKAFAFREGAPLVFRDVVKSEHIYSDAQKGELASPVILEKLFGQKSNDEMIEAILRTGEIHFTSNYLKKKRDDKLKQIISYIHEHGMDPKTKLPLPTTRIENALAQIKYSIDPFMATHKQAGEFIKKLRPVLAISIEKKSLQIHIPAQYAARVHGRVRSYGEVIKETWVADGSVLISCEVSAGGYDRLRAFLEQETHGGVKIEDVSQ